MQVRARWLTMLTLMTVSIGMVTAPPAWAATTTCSFSGGILTIASDTNASSGQFVRVARSDQVVLVVQHDENGQHLVDCGSPNLSETLKVEFTGTSPAADFEIDESGGPFITNGGQEVLFEVQMPGGEASYATVSLLAEPLGSRVVAGANGVDLHNDGDVDLTMSDVDSFGFVGSPSTDVVSANGGGSRGAPYPQRVVFFGKGGNDILRGGNTADLLLGGEGADTLYGGAGHDKLGPVETLYVSFDDNGRGNDRLFGEAGNDRLGGGAGNDVLDGGSGADSLGGQAGVDTVTYAASPSRVTVRLDGNANDGRTLNGSTEGDNVTSTVENVNGSAYSDLIVGNAAANRFSGGNGNDTLNGAAGNDTLSGENGNDTLKGGANTDTCNGGAGTDTLQACEQP